MNVKVKSHYHQETHTLSYIIYDQNTDDCIVIDPVLDYCPKKSQVSNSSLLKIIDFIKSKKLKVLYILETHIHADHFSGAYELKKLFKEAKIGVGSKIKEVQQIFKKIYNLKSLEPNGEQFDELFEHKQEVQAGSISFKVLFTPGHTPACCSYLFGEHVFTGDALFMPDFGTGRCDFPGGSAHELYSSISKVLYSLPDYTCFYTGHDYQPGGRELRFKSTIGESKKNNVHLKESTSLEEFVSFRTKRDQGLSPPALLHPSVQVNLFSGRLPQKEDNQMRYIKIPIEKNY